MRNKYQGADLSARIHGTLIRFKGKPYTAHVDGSSVMLYDMLKNKKEKVVSGDDPDLDISSIPLGYINYNKYKFCAYVQRNPNRQFRQGINTGALKYVCHSPRNGYVAGGVFNDQGFLDHCEGNYPALNAAIDLMTVHGWESVALSSEIALVHDRGILKVYLGTDEVGMISLKNKERVCNITKGSLSWLNRSLLGKVGIPVVEGLQ